MKKTITSLLILLSIAFSGCNGDIFIDEPDWEEFSDITIDGDGGDKSLPQVFWKLKFKRPPFGKQISLGLSAHAELTMPIFCINIGLGYDFVNPKGEKAFYQSLTLKTFITKKLYINTGYRLGSFKDPQNLML